MRTLAFGCHFGFASAFPAAPIITESITLDKNEMTLETGTESILTATVMPEDATDKTVVWTSSDETVATVDANGKVTALNFVRRREN